MAEIKVRLPRLPDKLPFEDTIDRGLNHLAEMADRAPPTQFFRQLHDKLPYLSETEVGTPFGTIRLPELSLPKLEPPQIDRRRREALKAAVAKDLAYFPALIPVVGDIVANAIEDTFEAKIYESMTKEEFAKYLNWDKKSPLSTVAVIQTFVRQQ